MTTHFSLNGEEIKVNLSIFLENLVKTKKKHLCNLYMENGGDATNIPFSWMAPYVSTELAKELVKLKQKHTAVQNEDEVKLNSDYFTWPTTLANEGHRDLPESSWPKVGMLKAVGYRVGACGLSKDERLEILKNVYSQRLPLIESSQYVSEWAEAHTSARLKKMAFTLAALTRNAKRKGHNMSAAVRDWEHDLRWLKKNFYEQYSSEWNWPSTSS